MLHASYWPTFFAPMIKVYVFVSFFGVAKEQHLKVHNKSNKSSDCCNSKQKIRTSISNSFVWNENIHVRIIKHQCLVASLTYVC